MTSAPSQLQQQLHDELLPLYGRPLNDSAVLGFLTRHGFKLPKTLHKSARGDGKIWLTHKKADVELLLATQPYNPLFPPLPAERKGMWMPRLTCAVFSGQHITLPAGLDWGASAEDAGQLLVAQWRRPSRVARASPCRAPCQHAVDGQFDQGGRANTLGRHRRERASVGAGPAWRPPVQTG